MTLHINYSIGGILMYSEIERLTLALCAPHGTPGCEEEVFKVAEKELSFCSEVTSDPLSGVTGILGNPNAKRRILLDAHIDQIGMCVTNIDDEGFLHLTQVGGIDRRTMPGSAVTVFGKETLTGIICTLPPHLSHGDGKVDPVDKQAVDLGMTKEEVEKLVSVGDRVVLTNPVKKLLNNRVSGTALDDRSGCACIIRAAQLVKDQSPDCCVMVVCSTREEVGGQGARIRAYTLEPTEAIAVDVSFATQPGTSGLTAELGGGPMIGFSSALDRKMSKKLIRLAKEQNIPYQLEAMGGRTGTNADCIGISRGGVRTGLISIPQRNMHTPAEVCDLEDMENIAKLIAAYIMDDQEA